MLKYDLKVTQTLSLPKPTLGGITKLEIVVLTWTLWNPNHKININMDGRGDKAN